jgi:NAD(P)-dependent dehydrogenase (short-subunit alcohol dehydrogenase family)
MTQPASDRRSVALVTGGGGGIGRAIALKLAATSAAVAIVDLDEGLGKETADLLQRSGCRSIFIRADVSSSKETAAFQVNAKGVFLGLKHVLAKMIPRGEGTIVNTASTSAIRGRAGLAGYVATKHAVLGLTRVAALDVAGTGIRVNAVLPGPVETRMTRALDEQARRASVGLGRSGQAGYGSPESVANVVAFLLSSEASHVNGASWVIDAGMTVP